MGWFVESIESVDQLICSSQKNDSTAKQRVVPSIPPLLAMMSESNSNPLTNEQTDFEFNDETTTINSTATGSSHHHLNGFSNG
jgi:hypothetical protein